MLGLILSTFFVTFVNAEDLCISRGESLAKTKKISTCARKMREIDKCSSGVKQCADFMSDSLSATILGVAAKEGRAAGLAIKPPPGIFCNVRSFSLIKHAYAAGSSCDPSSRISSLKEFVQKAFPKNRILAAEFLINALEGQKDEHAEAVLLSAKRFRSYANASKKDQKMIKASWSTLTSNWNNLQSSGAIPDFNFRAGNTFFNFEAYLIGAQNRISKEESL